MAEDLSQELSGMRSGSSGDFLGCPFATTWPPRSPPSGPEIDHIVGGLDDVEVVLDHDYRVAVIRQAAEHRE